MPAAASDPPGDGERDAGAAPVQLLGVDAAEQPVWIGAHPLDVVEPVEAPLARGLDALPRHALVAVVLRGDRPDHLAREAPAVRLVLELFVVEPEIHEVPRLPAALTDQSIVHGTCRRPRRAWLICAAMRRLVPALVLLALLGGCSLGDDETSRPPQLGVEAEDEEAAEKLGFPSSATRNTIRVGGSDAAADAAGVAGALFPATGATRPAHGRRAGRPGRLADRDRRRRPGGPADRRPAAAVGRRRAAGGHRGHARAAASRTGSDLSEDAQVIRIGPDVARPDGYKTALVQGEDAYERAAAIDRFFSAARGRPSNDVVLYSGERAEWAMPAASWAARSGDAALPVKADSIPRPIGARTRGPRAAQRVPARPGAGHLGAGGRRSSTERKLARSVNRIEGDDAGGERDRVRPLREGRLRLAA